MSKKKGPITATGKRKSAVASAMLAPGTGRVTINSAPVDFFGSEMYMLRIKEPILLAGEVASGLDVKVTVKGGGPAAQADAIRLAIARALAQHKKGLETTFLDYDRTLLVADVRQREPRKPNCRGRARAKRQKSYR